jgi:hypothetical protein
MVLDVQMNQTRWARLVAGGRMTKSYKGATHPSAVAQIALFMAVFNVGATCKVFTPRTKRIEEIYTVWTRVWQSSSGDHGNRCFVLRMA